MSAKFYEDIGYHGGLQAIIFLANQPSFKNFVALDILTFESMGKPQMSISRKQLVVERNGQKFGTLGPTVHICRLLLLPDSLSLVWGHSVHFANFRFYDFQNSTSPTIFIGSHPKFMRTLLTIEEWRLLLFLAIGQILQNLWYFEILTLESLWKPKMWDISKTAGHRAKQIIDRRAKQKLWHFKIFLTQDHMPLQISKCYFSHNFHWRSSKLMTTLVIMVNLNAC